MGRAHRVQIAGGLYHVNTPGNDGRAIVLDEADRLRFCRRLENALDFHGWACHAFCLMTTHYHILVETPEANLAAGMHWLAGWSWIGAALFGSGLTVIDT